MEKLCHESKKGPTSPIMACVGCMGAAIFAAHTHTEELFEDIDFESTQIWGFRHIPTVSPPATICPPMCMFQLLEDTMKRMAKLGKPLLSIFTGIVDVCF